MGALVLGSQLRHLRECRGHSPDVLAARLPGPLCLGVDAVTALEAGLGEGFGHDAWTGPVAAYLRGVDAGALALADYTRIVATYQRDHRRTVFLDDGVGGPWRYQVLEATAARVLLTAWTSVPGPLRTAGTQAAMLMEAVSGPAAPRPALPASSTALPHPGCDVCLMYRAAAPADPSAGERWQWTVGRARAESFDRRIGPGSGPETVLLLSEALLHQGAGGPHAHTAQMRLLADLHHRSRLQVQVVPLDSGVVLDAERAELDLAGRTLSARFEATGVSYREGPRHDVAFALARSYDPDTSARMLDQAADGTLRRPRRGW
ncbi:Scr1 family TA system antitoxin-like transcriptional regulator [Kitasatospora sp. NPDC089797]|uniref:Scr1 family TA system antitoxin-like transcriptional regulator n=1 Tax=Kitasatospora sp. NPDC089797 TaxID=3155298 RepID=UPI0034479FBE